MDNQLSSPKLTSSATATATGTANAACAAAPTLTGPADGLALNSRTVTFTWEAPQGCVPDGYTVRISADYDPEAKPWIVDTGWAPTDYTYSFLLMGFITGIFELASLVPPFIQGTGRYAALPSIPHHLLKTYAIGGHCPVLRYLAIRACSTPGYEKRQR